MPFPNPYKQRKAFQHYVATRPLDEMSDHELSAELLAWSAFLNAPVPVGKLEKAEGWTGWILTFGGFGLAFAVPPVGLGAAAAGLYLKGRDAWKAYAQRLSKELAGKRLQAVATEHVKRLKAKEDLLAAMAKPKHTNGELVRPAPPPAPEIPGPPPVTAPKTAAPEEAPPPPVDKDPNLPGA